MFDNIINLRFIKNKKEYICFMEPINSSLTTHVVTGCEFNIVLEMHYTVLRTVNIQENINMKYFM